jgi:hypothetical protein
MRVVNNVRHYIARALGTETGRHVLLLNKVMCMVGRTEKEMGGPS